MMTTNIELRDQNWPPKRRPVTLSGGPQHGTQIFVKGDHLVVAEGRHGPLTVTPGDSQPVYAQVRRGTYLRSRVRDDVFVWLGWDDETISRQCSAIADTVVPEYRPVKPPYPSCTSTTAKRRQAAWDAACIALGGDPKEYAS